MPVAYNSGGLVAGGAICKKISEKIAQLIHKDVETSVQHQKGN
jgi:hypothetical protein